MSDLFAGLVGLFILFVFGLIFVGGPIALIVLLIVRSRKQGASRRVQPPRRSSVGQFDDALRHDPSLMNNISFGAHGSSVESSSSWDSGGNSSSGSDW